MTVREQLEQREQQFLVPQACFSTDKKATARQNPEASCPYRMEFQRDRDRILHCSAFRRLKHKTQVFLSPVGDHYRTRLTHTLEVAQVARTIARALSLNEDLTEAIALGHDIGHSPFGHAGEAVLNRICPHGYHHYEQSVRVAEMIEQLNLTSAVLDGILCHTNQTAFTREGNIVRFADRIAYINHDIEDAVRAGVLSPEELPEQAVQILGSTKSERITALVSDVIQHGADTIGMNPKIQSAFDELHHFMYECVYLNPECKKEEKKAELLLEVLYDYFRKHPEKMPEEYQQILRNTDTDRAVCDYISGMSDSFAVNLYKDLFLPEFLK